MSTACTKEFTIPSQFGGDLFFLSWKASDGLFHLMRLDISDGTISDVRARTGYRQPGISNDSTLYYHDVVLGGYSRIGTDGSSPVLLKSDEGEYRGTSGADIVVVDDANDRLFYQQSGSGDIIRVEKTDSGQWEESSKVALNSNYIFGASLDTVNQKLYYVVGNAPTESYIRRCNLDGTGDELFYTSTYPFIQAVTVRPENGKIFWIECADDFFDDPLTPTTIYSGQISGPISKTELLVVEDIVPPADGTLLYCIGLVASMDPDRLYFSFTVLDGATSKGRISSIGFTGGAATNHWSADGYEPYGMVLKYAFFSGPITPPAQPGITPRIWLAQHTSGGLHKIYRYNLDGSGPVISRTLADSGNDYYEIHARSDRVYWFGYATQLFYWLNRPFPASGGVFNPTPTQCRSLHVSPTKVYAAVDVNDVYSWNHDGTGETLLFSDDPGESLHCISVDETNGVIYYSVVAGGDGKIYATSLTGVGKTLIASGLDPQASYWNLRMTVAPDFYYLFFYERSNQRIVRCNLVGGAQTVIVSGIPDYVWSMVSRGSYLYYLVRDTGAGTDRVYRCTHGGTDITMLIDLPDTQAMHVG